LLLIVSFYGKIWVLYERRYFVLLKKIKEWTKYLLEEVRKEIKSPMKPQAEIKSLMKPQVQPEQYFLYGGKYTGGRDIPTGIYDVSVVMGYGSFETNEPKAYAYFPRERNFNNYMNLEILDGTILKIDLELRIKIYNRRKIENKSTIGEKELIRVREDIEKEQQEINRLKNIEINQKEEISRLNGLIAKQNTVEQLEEQKKELDTEKGMLEGELSTIKEEIRILNNELIKKYYDFSDYDNIDSQDCKNKLLILKQEEKKIREREDDVVVQPRLGLQNKTKERIVRQILRTFNCECDNIIQNISLKNIDTARRKIQNSFESINKLYSVDKAFLTQALLELKLEQATLMYTYELKYQQEKDIQKSIKEQMMEEAKAEREIEEQKKKIEKDLQQHLGEINRMMKYMQKTQIDAEKQLYMDKIKELEEKIKMLEANKETVLEHEANAKAGFVYIISNIGSFGENIYKIGMTRRLEPMDRIHELSSASVPFEFDVHAMIFSSDAPELENTLHKHFADYAVNKVNPRKEFYNVDIDEIEKVVKENYNDTVQFTKIPIATEYRQSMNMQEVAP